MRNVLMIPVLLLAAAALAAAALLWHRWTVYVLLSNKTVSLAVSLFGRRKRVFYRDLTAPKKKPEGRRRKKRKRKSKRRPKRGRTRFPRTKSGFMIRTAADFRWTDFARWCRNMSVISKREERCCTAFWMIHGIKLRFYRSLFRWISAPGTRHIPGCSTAESGRRSARDIRCFAAIL